MMKAGGSESLGEVDRELERVPDWAEGRATDCPPDPARPVSADDNAENAFGLGAWSAFNPLEDDYPGDKSEDDYPGDENGSMPGPATVPGLPRHILTPRPLPGSHSWTKDPFRNISLPFGHFLEPDGYAAIREMQKPNAKSFARLMPKTADLAQSVLAALPQISVWGEHLKGRPSGKDERGRSLADASWATITQGKWINGKGRPFPQQQMKVMDMLNMLTHPEVHALGNQDWKSG